MTLLEEEGKSSVQILTVSPDAAADSIKMLDLIQQQRQQVPDFPLLSDPDHQVIDRYGLRNPETENLPYPAVLVIDETGAVRWKFVEKDHRIRASNEAILKALRELERE